VLGFTRWVVSLHGAVACAEAHRLIDGNWQMLGPWECRSGSAQNESDLQNYVFQLFEITRDEPMLYMTEMCLGDNE
jgi:hypothetical protein